MAHRLARLLALGFLLAVALAAAVAASSARAHDGADHGQGGTGQAPAADTARVDLRDLELIDRTGKRVRFASEAIGGRIVAIDFIYTTCTTICPVLSAIFAQVQDHMGERLGRDALLVSISIDPTRDTPRRLDAMARKFGAGPGWLWLTGKKRFVDQVLEGLDAYTPVFEDHASMILIGDPERGLWTRLFGFSSPDDIAARLEHLIAARAAKTTWNMSGRMK